MKFDSKEMKSRALRHIHDAVKIIDAIDTLEYFFDDKTVKLPAVESPPKELTAGQLNAIEKANNEKINRALLTGKPRPKSLGRGHVTERILNFLAAQKKPMENLDIALKLGLGAQSVRGMLERLVALGKVQRREEPTMGPGGGKGYSRGYRVVYAVPRPGSGGKGLKRGKRLQCEFCSRKIAAQQMANHLKSHHRTSQKVNGAENIQDRDIHIET